MQLVQFYETTIQDNDSHLMAGIVSIPRRSLRTNVLEGSEDYPILTSQSLMSELGLHQLRSIMPGPVESVLAALLNRQVAPQLWGFPVDTSYQAARDAAIDRVINSPIQSLIPEADQEFVIALVNDPLLPFEQSPLAPVSLKDIANIGGAGVGAYIGIVVAGPTPLLFITVPAGAIICGAAFGVAAGLEAGLRQRISSMLSSVRRPNP